MAEGGIDFDDAQQYAEQPDSLPVRVHLVVGDKMSQEDMSRFNASVTLLESRRSAGVTVTHQMIANCTHCATVAPAFQAGLVEVFS